MRLEERHIRDFELEILEDIGSKCLAVSFMGEKVNGEWLYECETDRIKHLFSGKMKGEEIEKICRENGYMFTIFIEENK